MEKQHLISILKNIYSLLAIIILTGSMIIFCLLKIKQDEDKLLAEASEPKFWCGMCADLYYNRENNPNFSKGEGLFNNNCVHCHTATAEIMVGPGLAGVRKRRDWKWIVKFTKNSQKFIKTNKEARKLFLKYNSTEMTTFENFTEDDIKAIFDYCERVNSIF